MKYRIIAMAICFICNTIMTNAQCFNAGAEQNNFINWTGYTGLNNNPNPGVLDLNTFTPGIFAGTTQHTIMQAGNFDQIVPMNVLPVVADGNHSIRLGYNNNGAHAAQIISYTVQVTQQQPKFSFRYAVVMVDPSLHTPAMKPFFSFWASTTNILNQSDQPGNLITSTKIVGDQSDPFFVVTEGNPTDPLLYKDWQTVCFDFTDFIGQNVTIYFATASCSAGAPQHFCYAYIDGLCSNNDPTVSFTAPSFICNSTDLNNITVDGSASKNYNDHQWEIREHGDPNTSVVQTFLNTPIPSSFDISQLYINGGQTFRNTTYRVTLWVRNCTGNWVPQTELIEVYEPEIIVEDKFACCNEDNLVNVVLEATINMKSGASNPTVEWYEAYGNNFIGNGISTISTNGNITTISNNITVQTAHSNKYRVVYTDGNGCTNKADVYVLVVNEPNNVYITQECTSPFGGCGTRKLTLQVEQYSCPGAPIYAHSDQMKYKIENSFTYSWSGGQSTKEVIYNPADPSQIATVSHQCFSKSAAINVAPNPFPGNLPTSQNLYYTTGMSGTQNFMIGHTGMPFPAYNANYYELKIFNQWGEVVYRKEEFTCLGFNYNDIRWDGVGNYGWHNGSPQPMGEYVFTLYLGNCDNSPTFIPFNNYSFTLVR